MNSIWVFIVVVILYSVGLVCAFRAGIKVAIDILLDLILSDNKNALMNLMSDADETDVRGPEGAE